MAGERSKQQRVAGKQEKEMNDTGSSYREQKCTEIERIPKQNKNTISSH